MRSTRSEPVYSLGLLRDVARWSVPFSLVVAIVGSLLTRDVRFGVSCAVGAAFDVGTLWWALRRTAELDPHAAIASRPFLIAYLLRLVVKAVLLLVAFFVPAWFDLWGMAFGVLTVDLTLATVGSVMTAWHTFRPGRPAA